MRILLATSLALLALPALAMPSLTGVQPLAIAPGKATEVKVIGNGFGNNLRLWTSFGGEVKLVKRIDSKQAIFSITAPKSATGIGALRLHDKTGLSEPLLILFDEFPTAPAASPNKAKPQPLKLTAAIDGKTGGVNSHWFALDVKAGQRLAIEVYAERIGSTADPMIRLLDPMGREVDYADDDDVLGSDAGLVHTAKLAGQYKLELRDVQYRSGLVYRLRVGNFTVWPGLKTDAQHVTEKEPNDDWKRATPLSLGKPAFGRIEKPGARDHFQFTGKKDAWVSFHAHSRSVGSPAYIYLELLNRAGSPIATTGTEHTEQVVLRHKLPVNSSYTLRVEELLRRGGPRFAYRITTSIGPGAFQLKLKADKNKADRFWAIPGQQLELPVQIERHGYDGPITLAAANGWPAAEPIKASAEDATIKFTVPTTAKAGQLHHLIITGTGGNAVKATLDLHAALRQRWPHMAFPPPALRGIVPVAVIEPVQISMANVKLKTGAKAKVRIITQRPPPPIGAKPAPQSIAIELKNLPMGLNAPEKINVDAKKDFVEFEFTATAEAKPGKHAVVIVAKSKYRNTEWTRESPPVTIEVLPK